MYEVTLDVAFDAFDVHGDEPVNEVTALATALCALTNGLAVEFRVLSQHGPGGNWPEVRFLAASRYELHALLGRYSGGKDADITDTDWLISTITEVHEPMPTG